MRKIILTFLATVVTMNNIMAGDFKTTGNGTVWTMTMLAETAGTGVVKTEAKTFKMTGNVEIAQGDKFKTSG